MNKDNAALLMKRLDEYREQFSMEWWFMDTGDHVVGWINEIDPEQINHCGTSACIAGHAAIISGVQHGRICDIAQEWLEMTDDEVTWLFEGYFTSVPLGDVTVEHAMDALYHLMQDKPIRVENEFGEEWFEIARPTND